MDSAVANALKRREELMREMREVERFLTLYERFRGDTSQQRLPGFDAPPDGEQASDESGPDADQQPSVEVDSPTASSGLTRMQLRPHIRAVIQEAQRPLTRGYLLRKLDQRGVLVGGNYDRSKNMGTIMWRLRDDFVNLPGQGYWPRNVPYPPAGYDPNEPPEAQAVSSDFDETLG